MPNQTITISRTAARRFLVQSFALDGFQTLPDVATAIDRLEFVQEDSINICGRIHDLLLWARVTDYVPSDLHRALYQRPRQAFEFYFPNLSVLPMRDFPYFIAAMDARQAAEGRWGALTDEEWPVAQKIYGHLDREGSIHVRESSAAHGHTTSGWGTRQKLATKVLEKMWLHGRLMIHSRDDFTRRYARAEHVLAETEPAIDIRTLPDAAEVERFRVRKRLRARRLFRLKLADRKVLGADAFAAVEIEGVAGRPWHVLTEDVPTLQALNEEAGNAGAADSVVHFLAPLDPLVYDRERNRALWDFDYIWEVYTPAAKRRWGYYALPILLGDRLIGRIDPKIDRKTGTLTINALHFETGVKPRDVARPIAARLAAYARWLGASRLDLAPTGLPQTLRRQLEKQYP